ncbi:MAG: amidase, partial [Rhodoferax sp.]|nr:amidase [Rhodoferax sp.]
APYFTQRPAERFLDGITRAPGPLRIAYTLQDFSGQPVHAECRAAVEAAAQLLAGLGHHVEAATPAF